MMEENIPPHRKPSFWVGAVLVLFGLLLWAFPELLSFLVGAFFVGLGVVLIGRALSPRQHWNVW